MLVLLFATCSVQGAGGDEQPAIRAAAVKQSALMTMKLWLTGFGPFPNLAIGVPSLHLQVTYSGKPDKLPQGINQEYGRPT